MNTKKEKIAYFCKECGWKSSKWLGKCPTCGAWSSFDSETVTLVKGPNRGLGQQTKPQKISEISVEKSERLSTGNSEFDRSLGGGLTGGSLILVGGDPGIGKSTLLLQTAANLAAAGVKCLYVTGEESPEQVKQRSGRLGFPGSDLELFCETRLPLILSICKETSPEVMIIDSIQTIYKDELSGTPGSIVQLRECTLDLMVNAKTTGCITMLVGHVTKEGQIAGPKVLEHMVDTVLYFEGESNNQYRVLRSIKNRFGATDEIGVFEMTASGLIPVDNPSKIFVQEHKTRTPGSVVSCTVEGTRALLFEIQGLVSSTSYSIAQRVAVGLDQKRLTIILALLDKFGGVHIGNSDVFASVAGGIRINDPATDLALAMALASNHLNINMPDRTLVIGELGLSGEVRRVSQTESRIREAIRLGYSTLIVPLSADLKNIKDPSINLIPVRTISAAMDWLNEKR
jgi:DNA repair protein RadA/Sms